MAQAQLTYDLNDPDDIMAHLRAVKSLDLALVLWELIHNSKKKMEWEIEQNKLDGYDTLDKMYERIYELMEERGIKIDELVN